MAEMWKRTLSFLGLLGGYDDEYDDVVYDDLPYDDQPGGPPPPTNAPAGPSAGRDEPTNVRRIAPAAPASRGSGYGRGADGPAERTERLGPRDGGSSRDAARGSGRSVRASTVHVTNPTTFNDVEEVGEKFRSGVPVIMNLASASESVAKRLLDFASGLIFGLDGRIERVGDRVFLLTPVGTEVSSEERNRLSESGFFNQA